MNTIDTEYLCFSPCNISGQSKAELSELLAALCHLNFQHHEHCWHRVTVFLSSAPGSSKKNGTKCHWSEFMCEDGSRCIPTAWKCDRDTDCSDRSDELHCCELCSLCSFVHGSCLFTYLSVIYLYVCVPFCGMKLCLFVLPSLFLGQCLHCRSVYRPVFVHVCMHVLWTSSYLYHVILQVIFSMSMLCWNSELAQVVFSASEVVRFEPQKMS